jgi:hypothetical protein
VPWRRGWPPGGPGSRPDAQLIAGQRLVAERPVSPPARLHLYSSARQQLWRQKANNLQPWQVEARYPVLNVDSPRYSQDAADWVIARMNKEKRAGAPPETALSIAVSDFAAMNEAKTKAAIAALGPKRRDQMASSRATATKQVTDEDFRTYQRRQVLCQTFALACVHDRDP